LHKAQEVAAAAALSRKAAVWAVLRVLTFPLVWPLELIFSGVRAVVRVALGGAASKEKAA
jgi:hypothetical protein